jgi:hypothetical protein
MSDLAKKARAAMKSKAERLGASRPMEKVSSADWSPPELLNADVKTGMRPVSRRAFKKGGKVTGEACAPRADRKPRKAGGKAEYKAEATEFANAKVNRNAKAANEEREGIKHVGALKSGGRAKKAEGGGFDLQSLVGLRPLSETKFLPKQIADNMKKGGRAKKADGGDAIGKFLKENPAQEKTVPLPPPRPKNLDAPKVPEKFKSPHDLTTHQAKRGGKIKKAEGGPLKFHGNPVIPGMKKGGKAHPDEAMDKALIKKMVKPEARKGKAMGGENQVAPNADMNKKYADFLADKGNAFAQGQYLGGQPDGMKKGGKAKHPDEKMVKSSARKGRNSGGASDFHDENAVPNPYRGSGSSNTPSGSSGAGKPLGKLFGNDLNRIINRRDTSNYEMKRGGKAKHSDEAMDRALIKKMVKPEARKGKNVGGMLGGLIPMAIGAMSGKDKDEKKHGGRTARKEGGGVFSGSGYPNKVPGVTGGRIARATGGKTKKGKAKTNINIVIAAGKPAGGADMMPPPSGIPTDNRGAGGLPVPVPPPQGAPAGMPMPMPVAMPMPMHGGAGAPAGAPPMPRKRGGRANGGQAPASTSAQPPAEQPQAPKPRYPTDAEVKAIMDRSVANIAREMGLMPAAKRNSGGRISKIASSYKDMQAGAGSGEGRLQKTDIAKKGKGAPTYKTGGKVYRSYKDMDAGAGSGRGRLEKTEIAARKH